MKISDNVEMLELNGKNGTVHPVIVWDNENLVLIDSGFPLEADLLEGSIKNVGFSLEKISKIILTHQDIDHIGNVKEVIESSKRVEVLAHEIEAPYIDGRKTPVKLEQLEKNLKNLPEESKKFYEILKVGFLNRRLHIHKTLKDGDIIPICGGIEVIHSPGHTPGHICLYLQKSEILIAGDALNIENGELVGCNPKHTLDLQESKNSIQKLLNYPIKKVVSYHCGLYEGNVKEAISKIAV